MTIPVPRSIAEGRTPNSRSLAPDQSDKLEQTRAALSRLAQQPDWVRRVVAFFEEGDGTQRNQVALLLSLKPEAPPEDVQERCWTVLREQADWYDRKCRQLSEGTQGMAAKGDCRHCGWARVHPRPGARTPQGRLHRPAGSHRAVPKSERSGCFEPCGLEAADWMAG